MECNDYSLAEQHIFQKLQPYRMSKHREFFQGSLEMFVQVIEEIIETVNNSSFTTSAIQKEKPEKKNKKDIDFMTRYSIQAELVKDYEEILSDADSFQKHVNLIHVLSPADDVYEITDVKTKHKLEAIQQLSDLYGVSLFNLDIDDYAKGVQMTDDMFDHIHKLFRTRAVKPTTYFHIVRLYVALVKTMTGSKVIISSRCNKVVKRDKTIYTLNEKLLREHLKLFCKIKRKNCSDLHPRYLGFC